MYKKYFLFEKEYCILNIFRLLKLIKVTALPNFLFFLFLNKIFVINAGIEPAFSGKFGNRTRI